MVVTNSPEVTAHAHTVEGVTNRVREQRENFGELNTRA